MGHGCDFDMNFKGPRDQHDVRLNSYLSLEICNGDSFKMKFLIDFLSFYTLMLIFMLIS